MEVGAKRRLSKQQHFTPDCPTRQSNVFPPL